MSQCTVPNWNLSPQRKEQVEGDEERNRSSSSSHVHSHFNPHISTSHLVPMCNYGVAELTWENGQLAMHGLSGLQPNPPTKLTWAQPGDTLESIVRQATSHKQSPNPIQQDQSLAHVSPGGRKCNENFGREPMAPPSERKRTRSGSEYCGRNIISSSNMQVENGDLSTCASASATFCRDNDTTLMTWASFESPQSLKTKTTEEDSACHGGSENMEEERDIKAGRSNSTRRSRTASVHNQSERRRRDRINQKMKALQRLVPNASKTDKASMLDEVIEYLKQLQAQIQLMSMRNMPQMIMPIGMQQQQQLQMSLLARMGMGVGLGMGMGVLGMGNMTRNAPQSLPQLVHPTPVATAAPAFVPSPFFMPPMIPTQPKPNPAANTSVPLPDPLCAYLAEQSMNMDIYNKMAAAAALYRHQVCQNTKAASSPSQSNHAQRD